MEALIAYGLIAIAFIAILAHIIYQYNRMVTLRNYADKAFANIDLLLRQRSTEIPKLIQIVQSSAQYEERILSTLSETRTAFLNSQTVDEKTIANNKITHLLDNLFILIENYPELNSMRSYLDLQHRLSKIETSISQRREFFNESIALFNIAIKEFPNIIYSALLGFKTRPFLNYHDTNNDSALPI